MAAGKRDVRIRDRCSVYVDGELRIGGQIVSLPKAEADTLVEQGVAEDPVQREDPPAPEPKRRPRGGEGEPIIVRDLD